MIKEKVQEDQKQEAQNTESKTTETKKEIKKPGLVKRYFKSFVDVKRWVSYDEISNNTKFTFNLFKRFFSTPKVNIIKETFEESLVRLNLTENDLAKRKMIFLQSAILYTFIDMALIAYVVYLVTKHKSILSTLFTLILIAFTTISAYHKHFWYMQITKRQLGCTFNDWIKFIFCIKK